MQDAIREKANFYKTIINNLRGGILIINSNNKIVYGNEMVHKLLGYSERKLLNTCPFSISFNKKYILEELITNKENKILENLKVEFQADQFNEGLKWFEISFSVYFNENNKADGIICVINDITHRRNAERKIKNLSELSEENPSSVLQFSFKTMSFIYSNKSGKKIIEYLQKEENKLTESQFLHAVFNSYNNTTAITERVKLSINNMQFLCKIVPVVSESYVNIYATDVTEMNKADKANVRSKQNYKRIIEGLQLGLLEIANDNKIIKTFPFFCEMTGYSENELKGKNIIDFLITPNYKNIAINLLSQREEKISTYELQIRKKDGNKIWVQISGVTLYNENNEIVGSLGMCLDMTKRREMEELLIMSRYKAEESSKAKERFLANMSHEIRTPMNAIIGMSKLLKETALNDTQDQYLKAIKISADNLLVIINDILDLSKIETGKLKLDKTGFRLTELLHSLTISVNYKAEKNNVLLKSMISFNAHDILISDPVRLNQILLNFTCNAIKFSPNETVRIECKQLYETKKSVTIKFDVTDTGIGIAKDKLDYIFENFTQEDQSINRKFGGTGLGLPISKQLVELFGGKIGVDSIRGQGSTFFAIIEFEKGSTKDLTFEEKQPIENASLTGLKILLVEDNEMNRLLAFTLLKKWKIVIDVAENGKIALQKIKINKYDLVLMDMQMPEMGGVEATRIIRAEIDKSIPIIALTANVLEDIGKKCIEAGMNDYISKPFEPHLLFNKISYLVKKKNDVPPTIFIDKPCRKAKLNQSLYNLTRLQKMSNNNKGFVDNMIKIFIKRTPKIIKLIEKHYLNKEYDNISELVHQIKPSIDTLNIEVIKPNIKDIEKYTKHKSNLDKLPLLIQNLKTILTQVVKQMQLHS